MSGSHLNLNWSYIAFNDMKTFENQTRLKYTAWSEDL